MIEDVTYYAIVKFLKGLLQNFNNNFVIVVIIQKIKKISEGKKIIITSVFL